jgi:hypothetical protein
MEQWKLSVVCTIKDRTMDYVQQIQCPGVKLGHPSPRGYKYGNLTLQVGGVSDETVKYAYGF